MNLREKLRESGIPDELHASFVEFQELYAGQQQSFNGSKATWGILLDSVESISSTALTPGEVDAFCEDGTWQVICAHVHVSDTATIDQHGRLYWSYRPWYSSYHRFFQGEPPDLRSNP